MKDVINIDVLMELLRALETRGLDCKIEHCRASSDCDGIRVTVRVVNEIWELGFFEWADIFENDEFEVGKFVLSGDVRHTTLEALLSELDTLRA